MEMMRVDQLLPDAVESPVDEYLRLRSEITMLQARAAEVLGVIDRDGLFDEAGYLTAAAFVVDRAGDSWDAARRAVAEARGLTEHPHVREAFASATIDRPRVGMLLGAARVSPRLFERDEAVLVDSISGLSMRHAFRALEYWKQAADREASARDADHLHDRGHLHVSRTLGGMVRVDGELDPEGGEIVTTALRAMVEPGNLDANDGRSSAQRRADALVELCADHLAHGDTPVSGGVRPHLTLTVRPESLAGLAPGLLGDGVIVTSETARRVACDATVTEITGDGGSVLDVGRARRTIPAAMRRALVARDGGCVHPGCGRPHRWCDAHHVVHWADGGPTSLANLVLLCRRHHRMRHEGARAPSHR
ncbi:MAG: DUF222 domain-containing protein [Acidimicrobiia bacterium]|nr:DUF222 domain-containing protein [Acidimicrobiia bacterium]